jgi:hypothetical protein
MTCVVDGGGGVDIIHLNFLVGEAVTPGP